MAFQDKQEALEAHQGCFEAAAAAPQFALVAFYIDSAGTLHCETTTWQFPADRYLEALGLLTGQLRDRQAAKPAPPQPLPDAEKEKLKRFLPPNVAEQLGLGAPQTYRHTTLPVDPADVEADGGIDAQGNRIE